MAVTIEPLIVDDIKKSLGLAADYDPFDGELSLHINSALADLHQLGVGPDEGFQVTTGEETWAEFLGTDEFRLNNVRGYLHLAVRLLFDPPTSPPVLTAMKDQFERAEFRVALAADEIRRPAPLPGEEPTDDSDLILDGGVI